MNKCPVCDDNQNIGGFGIITRKRISCRNCKSDLIIIETPLSFFIDSLFIIASLGIYALLRRAGYGLWIWLPLTGFTAFVAVVVRVKIPSNFNIATAETLGTIRREERINLLLLAGFFGLFVSVLYFLG